MKRIMKVIVTSVGIMLLGIIILAGVVFVLIDDDYASVI